MGTNQAAQHRATVGAAINFDLRYYSNGKRVAAAAAVAVGGFRYLTDPCCSLILQRSRLQSRGVTIEWPRVKRGRAHHQLAGYTARNKSEPLKARLGSTSSIGGAVIERYIYMYVCVCVYKEVCGFVFDPGICGHCLRGEIGARWEA